MRRRDFITLIGSTAIGWTRGAWEPRCTAAVNIALTVEVREPSCFSTAEVGYPRRCPWGRIEA